MQFSYLIIGLDLSVAPLLEASLLELDSKEFLLSCALVLSVRNTRFHPVLLEEIYPEESSFSLVAQDLLTVFLFVLLRWLFKNLHLILKCFTRPH